MDQTAQCGRTFVHQRHTTTDGECPGLPRDTVPDARTARARQDARDALDQPTLGSA